MSLIWVMCPVIWSRGAVGLVGLGHHPQALVAALGHGADGAGALLLEAVDHALDLGGGGGGAAGEVAYLVGHHGENHGPARRRGRPRWRR